MKRKKRCRVSLDMKTYNSFTVWDGKGNYLQYRGESMSTEAMQRLARRMENLLNTPRKRK